MQKILSAVLFLLLFAPIAYANETISPESAAVPIPEIEAWPLFTQTEMFRTAMIAVHIDPQGAGYEGMVVYQKTPEGEKPLLKVWNYKFTPANPFDFSRVRTALKLPDGTWFVGEKGESVLITGMSNGKCIEFRFSGKNSDVARTICPLE